MAKPPTITQKCRLVFDPTSADEPTLWTMSRQFPAVQFDIRLDDTGVGGHVMSVVFRGESAEVESAFAFLREAGVEVHLVEDAG